MTHKQRQTGGWSLAIFVVAVCSLIPVLWIIFLSLEDAGDRHRRELHSPSMDAVELLGHLQAGHLHRRASQLDRDRPDLDGSGRGARIIRGVRNRPAGLPGKQVILLVALAVAMFPQISLVGPLYNLWRQIGLYDTWPGLDHPVHDVRPAAVDLRALGVLQRDTVGARGGGPG